MKFYMRKLKILFWCIALITICLNGFTQYKKNAVVLELAGKSPPVSVCYQRFFSERFNIGAGIGMSMEGSSLQKFGDFYRKRINFNAPVYFGYSFGQKKSRLSSASGITFCLRWVDQSLLSGKTKKFELLDSAPFFSLGYEYRGEKYFFNIPVYLLRLKIEEWSEEFVGTRHIMAPYIGVRIGRMF